LYKIRIEKAKNLNEYEELIKIFLPPGDYQLSEDGEAGLAYRVQDDKDEVKRRLYDDLAEITGKRPPWGILTGIRPIKLTGELLRETGSVAETRRRLREHYRISREKTDLALEIYQRQVKAFARPPQDSAGIYIGIPFCPTRCLYCSFASNQVDDSEIARYFTALQQEITQVGRMMRDRGIEAESLYVGGGTPTSLSAQQMAEMLQQVREEIPSSRIREITVEAGRPDTITGDKLAAMHRAGVTRISINPQTMNDRTLVRIGREHTAAQVDQAFAMAREEGFEVINMDLIAGLPGEESADFAETLEKIISLGPENITVHSLAVKRASRLAEADREYHYSHGELVSRMLEYARNSLREHGYQPYYLYRQKHMSGAQENTGYCLPGSESLYNVRIMDEHQHIIAMGAGGISKVYFPRENRLQRVPNVTNYQIYIERIEEMIRRKQNAY
jgi:coproporphyrinogen dehydrogenase HemZ